MPLMQSLINSSRKSKNFSANDPVLLPKKRTKSEGVQPSSKFSSKVETSGIQDPATRRGSSSGSNRQLDPWLTQLPASHIDPDQVNKIEKRNKAAVSTASKSSIKISLISARKAKSGNFSSPSAASSPSHRADKSIQNGSSSRSGPLSAGPTLVSHGRPQSSPHPTAVQSLPGASASASSKLNRQLFSTNSNHPAVGPPTLPPLTCLSSSQREISRAVDALRELSSNLPSFLTATQRCYVNNLCLEHNPAEDTTDDGLEVFTLDCTQQAGNGRQARRRSCRPTPRRRVARRCRRRRP